MRKLKERILVSQLKEGDYFTLIIKKNKFYNSYVILRDQNVGGTQKQRIETR